MKNNNKNPPPTRQRQPEAEPQFAQDRRTLKREGASPHVAQCCAVPSPTVSGRDTPAGCTHRAGGRSAPWAAPLPAGPSLPSAGPAPSSSPRPGARRRAAPSGLSAGPEVTQEQSPRRARWSPAHIPAAAARPWLCSRQHPGSPASASASCRALAPAFPAPKRPQRPFSSARPARACSPAWRARPRCQRQRPHSDTVLTLARVIPSPEHAMALLSLSLAGRRPPAHPCLSPRSTPAPWLTGQVVVGGAWSRTLTP